MVKATKTFVRFDSNGNMIPGTMINAIKKPIDGQWKEITENKLCCNPYTEVTCTPTFSAHCSFYLVCSSNGLNLRYYSNTSVSTVEDILAIANTSLSWLGDWVTDGTTITLKMKQSIADDTCSGTFTLTIADD